MRPLLISAFAALALSAFSSSWSSDARADVAPPPDEKEVDYSFIVRGIDNPDLVVFAYPCGQSSGAPIDTIALVANDKQVTVGSRGGSCALYTTSKTAWDTFSSSYVPANKYQDPILQDFASKATKCTGGPTPTFIISIKDTRSAIQEELDATKFSASECTITSKSLSQNNSNVTDGDSKTPPGPPASPGAPTTTTTTTPASAAPPQSSDSGGGCSVSRSMMGDAGPWLLAIAVPVIVLGSRRKKKKSSAA